MVFTDRDNNFFQALHLLIFIKRQFPITYLNMYSFYKSLAKSNQSLTNRAYKIHYYNKIDLKLTSVYISNADTKISRDGFKYLRV